jgi:plastocyanin
MTTLALVLLTLAPAAPAQVTVQDNAFRPRVVTVRVGRAVTWRWRGRRRHDVWFEDERRPCRRQRRGSCTRRFRRRGSVEYFCTLHGSMTGLVRVTSRPAARR